jgi:D-inositol-3-phosphate glycosyltransferase
MVSEHASPLATLGETDAGGQNVHVAALADALVGLGCQVTVHTRRDDPSLPRRVVTPSGVVVDHVDAGPPSALPKDSLLPWMGDFAADLQRRWAEDRPDVAHAHFWMSGLAALTAAPRLDVPVIQTFHALGTVKRRHQGAADTSAPERLDIERRIVQEADHVIATCADEESELVAMGGDAARISIIPCGVDLDLFRPSPARPSGAGRPWRIVVVGRLVERKGIEDVVAALAGLEGAELVIAGGPPSSQLDHDGDVARIRRAARQAGVGDRVRLLGQLSRQQVPALIAGADVVVSVPRYEPFGIVALEAMACGVPVVVSDVGGLRESVVDGVTGLHVPPGDPGALGGALQSLLSDPARRAGMGRAGVTRVRQRYGWPRIAALSHDVYRRVVLHSAPTARATR